MEINATKYPRVIVLILSYNGKSLLDESISTYLANDYPNFEVAVIDNGSTDGTKEYVEKNYPGVTLLRTDVNLKYSGGFNFGLSYAFEKQRADYVLITNNDVKAGSKVLSSLVATAEKDNNIGFVTGKVYFYENPETIQSVGYYEDPVKWIGGHRGDRVKDTGQFEEELELPYSDDIFMLVRKQVYDAVGGYNTIFAFQGEQLDWQVRAKQEGFRVFYSPRAMIWHKDSITIGKSSPFKVFYDVRNTLLLRLLHKDQAYFRVYVRWHFKNMVFRPLLRSLTHLRFKYAFKIIHGYLSFLSWGFRNKKLTLKHFI
ncbi:MAG: glycosyltransferase family 2 protein [Bacteroidetes bacterium]|nr:glycosyltransferase family 2 protein [Bacteroidota bacterium]